MGTWGTGAFDSDTADEFLDELEVQTAPQRQEVVENTFRSAINEGGISASSVLPVEVLTAAAVVAANITSGRDRSWHQEYPDIVEWLAKPVASNLASSANQALETALPSDGWFWRSWVDADQRQEAKDSLASLKSVVQSSRRRPPGALTPGPVG